MKPQFTKIVATLGPASSGPEKIAALMKAGVSVFRMNFSHGEHKTHRENYLAIRRQAKQDKRFCSILADLQGPKLRIGKFKNGSISLASGQKFTLDMNAALGDETRVSLMHPEIFAILEKQMVLALNDGQIQLKVNSFGKKYVHTTVLVGGILSDHKGVNVPNVILPISAITEKDKKDLAFALKLGVDWICLSFVQTPEDVRMARRIIGESAGIIVKIEKPSALLHLDEIIDLADGIMVARGDLGVECAVECVPAFQRRIIETCRRTGKPVIVATQMLESMINAPFPTRAEVSDIATAVYEGADAVMLSAETAIGRYPVQAVAMMSRIIAQTQQDDYYAHILEAHSLPPDKTVASAITSSLRDMVKVLAHPACIITHSISGKTTLRTARERTLVPILGMTVSEKIANRIALVWGVHPVLAPNLKDMSEVSPWAVKYAKEAKLAKIGDEVIVTAGIPFAQAGNTNILHIATIK